MILNGFTFILLPILGLCGFLILQVFELIHLLILILIFICLISSLLIIWGLDLIALFLIIIYGGGVLTFFLFIILFIQKNPTPLTPTFSIINYTTVLIISISLFWGFLQKNWLLSLRFNVNNNYAGVDDKVLFQQDFGAHQLFFCELSIHLLQYIVYYINLYYYTFNNIITNVIIQIDKTPFPYIIQHFYLNSIFTFLNQYQLIIGLVFTIFFSIPLNLLYYYSFIYYPAIIIVIFKSITYKFNYLYNILLLNDILSMPNWKIYDSNIWDLQNSYQYFSYTLNYSYTIINNYIYYYNTKMYFQLYQNPLLHLILFKYPVIVNEYLQYKVGLIKQWAFELFYAGLINTLLVALGLLISMVGVGLLLKRG